MPANMKAGHFHSSPTIGPSYPESTKIRKTAGCRRNLSPLKFICIFPCGLIYGTKVDVLIMPHFMLEFALDKLAAPRGGRVLLRSEPWRLKSALPLRFPLRVTSGGEK